MLDVKITTSSGLHCLPAPRPYEVIIVMPMIDRALAAKASEVMKQRTQENGLLLLVEDDLRLGFIMVCNIVYAKTSSTYFAYVAQDAYPGEFWLDYGLETIKKHKCGLLAFNDGRFFGKVAVLGLVDRTFANSLYKNFVFYPKYKSHYADTELSVIALSTSNLVYNPNAVLIEVDYEKHLHRNNNEDEKLYTERAKTGFNGLISPFIPDAQ